MDNEIVIEFNVSRDTGCVRFFANSSLPSLGSASIRFCELQFALSFASRGGAAFLLGQECG